MPTPSNAEPLFPLNHTFDATGAGPIGTPPPNADFETPGYWVSPGRPNADFSLPQSDIGPPPENGGFERGDLIGWSIITGTAVITSETSRPNFARLSAGAILVSSAFTVTPSADFFTFDLGYLSVTGTSRLRLVVLTGTDFVTSTQVADLQCAGCGRWETKSLDARPYRGQAVKLRFEAVTGEVGIDSVRPQILVPGYIAQGAVNRAAEPSGNPYVELSTDGQLETEPFTVDAQTQYLSFRINGLSGGIWGNEYKAFLLSGPGFATSTQIAYERLWPINTWFTKRYNFAAWQGQTIKLRVVRLNGRIGLDDVGLQRVEAPNWSVSGDDTTVESGGPTGRYLAVGSWAVSSAFTLPTNTQQLSLRFARPSTVSTPLYHVWLQRGTGFTETVQLGSINPTDQWQTAHFAVQNYAGETVKLKVEISTLIRGSATVWLDNVGLMEEVLPGWRLTTTEPITVGNDLNGSYISPLGGGMSLRSSFLQSAVIDGPNVDIKYFAFTLDVDASVRIWWDNGVGNSWQIYSLTLSPGLRTIYLPVYDFMGQRGFFAIRVNGSGKLYSLADNVARQQLSEPFSQRVGLGIDTSTGAFGYEERDLASGGAMPLVFTRYYNGQSDSFGPLGFRWTHSFDAKLVVEGGDVGVVFGSGRELFFVGSGNPPTFRPADARVHDTLVRQPDGTYTLTTTDNLGYHFEAPTGNPLMGRLMRVADPNGRALTLAYDTGTGRLASVTGPGGHQLTLAYDATSGRLASVTDPAGSRVSYGYDAQGDLVAATVPYPAAGPVTTTVRTYGYDRHRLTRATDANGQPLIANTYDALQRVATQTDALSKTITLAYSTPAKGVTSVTDPAGRTASYYFDGWGRTTDKVDPLNNVVSYLFDGEGNLQRVIDPAFNQWAFAYDSGGNLTGSTDPLNQRVRIDWDSVKHLPTTLTDALSNTTRLEYDPRGNLTKKTDPLGGVWLYSYDAAGNLLGETNPLSQTTSYTYDGSGNRTSKTNPLGRTWTWTYDAAGRVRSETDPLGNRTEWVYDAAGRRIAEIDPLGQTTTYLYAVNGALLLVADPSGTQTAYGYDVRGLVITETTGISTVTPLGFTTTYTYDDNRNLTSVIDPNGNSTRYTYDANNRVQTATDAESATTTFTYDSNGNISSLRDPLGYTTLYTYTATGKLAQQRLANGATTTFTYDANGNLIAEIDHVGRTTTYGYDALNRRVRQTDSLGRSTTYSYDAAGRLLATTNALSQTTTLGYDAAGNVISRTNALGEATTYAYDAAGHQVATTDPLGRTTSTGYDRVGRTVVVTNALGLATTTHYAPNGQVARATSPSGRTTNYRYDPRGLLVELTDPLGFVTRYGYDAGGRPTSVTDPLGRISTTTYDRADRETSVSEPGPVGGGTSVSVGFGYDAAGRMTHLTNPRGKTATATYDALGNQLSESDPLSRVHAAEYDALGRLWRRTDARGITTEYTYDAGDRVTRVASPFTTVSYAYDALGRRAVMTDTTGVTTWSYDAAGRLTAVASPQGGVSYTYHRDGQRASMTLPGNRTVSYAYDAGGRLSTLTDWAGRTIGFGYNAEGERTVITRPNGVRTDFTYDAGGRLSAVAHTSPSGLLRRFDYAYDALGNRVAVTLTSGVSGTGGISPTTGVERYTLDALNRITAVTFPNGESRSFTYDPNGNRLTHTVSSTAGVTTTSASYDDADQTIAEGSVTYSHDPNGNVTRIGGNTFAWDGANRLSSVAVGPTTASYLYDGDGVRVARTVTTTTGTTTVTYLWDRATGLPLLVDDGSTAYLHAPSGPPGLPGQGGILAQIDAAGTPLYHLADALGSVRGQTSLSGALTGTADYDPFGALRPGSSGLVGPFGFSGEQHDPETGFLYLRARYHNPASGRFMSADPVQPNAPGTQGYHPYTYVANNPTTWADPSGHQAALAQWLFTGMGLSSQFQVCVSTPACLPLLAQLTGTLAALAIAGARGTGLAVLGLVLATVFLVVAILLFGLIVPLVLQFADATFARPQPESEDDERERCLKAKGKTGGKVREHFQLATVYLGFDKTTGEVTYAGISEQKSYYGFDWKRSLVETWTRHDRNGKHIYIHPLSDDPNATLPPKLMVHPGVAAKIERKAYGFLIGLGKPLKNKDEPTGKPNTEYDRRCDRIYEAEAERLRPQWQSYILAMDAQRHIFRDRAKEEYSRVRRGGPGSSLLP